MNTQKADLLRLILPPLRDEPWARFTCVLYTAASGWHIVVHESLAEIRSGYQAQRVEACLHPSDLSLAELALPPLPAKRQRSAVIGALELLSLTEPENLAIGFGRRGEDGKVPVCWTASSAVQAISKAFQQHGLTVHALLPAPAFLPAPSSGSDVFSVSATLLDGWIVARTSADRGFMHPLPEGQHSIDDAKARFQQLIAGPLDLQWFTNDLTGGSVHASSEGAVPWTGADWPWSMTASRRTAGDTGRRWLRPAVCWGIAAAAIWVLGLNVHSHQVASEGLEIRRTMAAQVKAAFPEISVVINPLQQARQGREARLKGGRVVNESAFPALARASASLLDKASGQVQRLQYYNNQIDIQWREGAALRPEELDALQAQADELGITVQPGEVGIRLQISSGQYHPVHAPEAVSPAASVAQK